MSECVVRMEMPQHCGECNLYVNGWCYALTPDSPQEKEWYASHKERPPMCPILCQLPEGHGRLVDADALKEWFIEQIDYYKRFDGPNCSMMVSAYEAVCRVINDAHTIVPAERRANDGTD